MHDAGYRFNESGRIQDLTTTQQRMVGLWNAAEAYLQQVRSRQARSGRSSVTEQRKHDHEARLARKSMDAQTNGGVS